MTINDRISLLLEALEYNENSFAKAISVSASVVFNMVNPKGRKSYPSGPVLEKILSLEKNGNRVSANWLIRGEGSMFEGGESASSIDTSEIEKSIELLSLAVDKLRKDLERLNDIKQ